MNLRKHLPLVAVLIIGFLIRMQNVGFVFSGDFYPQGFDPFYYIRLAEIVARTGQWPAIDHYVNYPFGFKVGWLPGYGYLLSLPLLLFGFGAGKFFDAFIPVILSLISTLLIYLIAKEIFIASGKEDSETSDIKSYYYATLAALFFTVSPIIVYRSVVGFLDHHIWVVTLLLSATYFALKRTPRRTSVLPIAISGIFLTLLAVSWRGAPIYGAILALSLLMSREPVEIRKYALCFAIPVLSAAVILEAGISFLLLGIFLCIGSFAKSKNLTLHYVALSIIVVAALYLVPLQGVMYVNYIKRGLDFIFERNIILPTVVESKSFQIMQMLWITGFLIAVFALPGIFFQRNMFVNTWYFSSLALAMLQLRFAEIWIFPVALLSAYTMFGVLEKASTDGSSKKLKERTKHKKKKQSKQQSKQDKTTNKIRKKEKREKVTSTGDIAALLILIAFIISPSLAASVITQPLTQDWKDALLWIRKNTEPTSYYFEPDKNPEYSILCWWNYGNWVVYVAKRPTVTNNNQPGTSAYDVARFFVSQNENEAMKIVKKRGVRYVITTDMEKIENYFASIMITAGLNPDKIGLNETFGIYNNSIFYKLHVEDAESLQHFKLVRVFGGVKIFRVEEE